MEIWETLQILTKAILIAYNLCGSQAYVQQVRSKSFLTTEEIKIIKSLRS